MKCLFHKDYEAKHLFESLHKMELHLELNGAWFNIWIFYFIILILLLYPILYPVPEIKFCCSEYNSLVLHHSLSSSLFAAEISSN